MNKNLLFTRLVFAFICTLLLTLYTVSSYGFDLPNLILGIIGGLGFSGVLIAIDLFLISQLSLRIFNTILFGLFCGYLLGEIVMLIATSALGPTLTDLNPTNIALFKISLFMLCIYCGLTLVARTSEEFLITLPYVRFKSMRQKKKDIVVDWSIFMDSRVLDIASSGLLDDHLIIPKFALNELYMMLESIDEGIKSRARRSLDVFKKLEEIPTLEMRFSEIDFHELKDSTSKLVQLARALDANIITADVARFQPYITEGIRIINIHMLSNVLKPMVTGEFINIKVQRYGKEPRQGVGYLDDGTMVVVNGGAEYLGEIIKTQVLSVKHTSSGRMIFCNASEDAFIDGNLSNHASLESNSKGYFGTL